MAENQSETAVQEQPFIIKIEDAGPATKKVSVEVPKEKIAAKIADQYKELRQGAPVPGFRKGRVPQKLLEKRFGTDVKEQVRRALISEGYQKAVEEHKLTVLGEPDFDKPDDIKLTDDAPMQYSFSVEVQPDITLPELKGVKVRKPRIEITDEHINQAMMNLREQQGTLTPVEDRGVESKDVLTADVHVKINGAVVSEQHDAQLTARPGRLAGLQVDDLDTQLAGTKIGETREVVVQVPETSRFEHLRGKEVRIDITVKEIKRLEPAEIDQQFLEELGFKDEAELRQALRDQMQERIDFDIKQVMRRQVIDQLLTNTQVELPVKLSGRQADRIVNRRRLDLMVRGVPMDRIDANLETLKAGAEEEGARELKTFFILQKVSEQEQVDVSDEELNGRIAMMAIQQGQRPERFRQQMEKDGSTLMNLYIQMREEKAIDKVLETAEVEEVEATAEEQKAVTPGQAAQEQAEQPVMAEGATPPAPAPEAPAAEEKPAT